MYLQLDPQTLDQATQLLPGGGYTTFRTFGRFGVLRMVDHYHRLEETAQLAGKPVHINRQILQQALHEALFAYPADEMRVRVILDLEQNPGDIYILVDGLHTPSQTDYEYGVKAVTRQMQRSNAKAKLTEFISTASAIREQLPAGVNEAIMVGADGCLLEGLSSNFFAVVEGVVWTADEGVLSGITRSAVLSVINQAGIPLELRGLPAERLQEVSEAFITSTSRAVLPVTEIDGKPVGSGSPGEVTLRLLDGYQQWLVGELETV
jgi:branched-chain amino acid aminotransferase